MVANTKYIARFSKKYVHGIPEILQYEVLKHISEVATIANVMDSKKNHFRFRTH